MSGYPEPEDIPAYPEADEIDSAYPDAAAYPEAGDLPEVPETEEGQRRSYYGQVFQRLFEEMSGDQLLDEHGNCFIPQNAFESAGDMCRTIVSFAPEGDPILMDFSASNILTGTGWIRLP